MALQALAPYYSDGHPEVQAVVNKALACLSAQQDSEGGFKSGGTDSSESVSQTMIALSSLGIDMDTNSMFIKNNNTLLSALLQFSNAQQTIGLDRRTGSLSERVKKGMRVISILLSWSMEDAIETADSMKARGYGLKNRTTFSLFKFDKRDGLVLGLISVLAGICFAGYFSGYGTMQFYPSIRPLNLSPQAIALYLVFAVLAFLPIFIEVRESCKWRS